LARKDGMAKEPTSIYHITHKDNLRGIVAGGALIAQSQIKRQAVGFCNIAHSNIQDRRAQTPVPCGPGGFLHDYVPLYFAPRSPMLYAIHKGNVDGCTAGQADIVYLVTRAQRIQSEGLDFVFTDGHGTMALSDFFDDLADLEELDWEIMRSKYWADTDQDPDRKRRRQAEFLVYRRLPWSMIEEICTMNGDVASEVQEIIRYTTNQPSVNIRRNWYY
jgi:hypothetical protein